ncbi:MAG: ABC transporter permease [Pseudomonadota bacterium]
MTWLTSQNRRGNKVLLGLIPILVVILVYLIVAADRNAMNPAEKITPMPSAMVQAMWELVFEKDQLSGRYLFWSDTWASLQRLGLGLLISTLTALVVGLLLGVLPTFRATFGMTVTSIAVIPPIALLPILFIVFGLGETAKVALIVVGIAPFMVRDLAAYVSSLPHEQVVKARTLGASTWQLILRFALPQAMPRLIQALRLSLGPAWVFLISAEAIASDVGLGYRIFLVRRYLAMDVILPYVLWIAALAALIDWLLAASSKQLYPWSHGSER